MAQIASHFWQQSIKQDLKILEISVSAISPQMADIGISCKKAFPCA